MVPFRSLEYQVPRKIMLCSSGKEVSCGLPWLLFFSDPSSYVVDQNIIQKYPSLPLSWTEWGPPDFGLGHVFGQGMLIGMTRPKAQSFDEAGHVPLCSGISQASSPKNPSVVGHPLASSNLGHLTLSYHGHGS